MSDNASAATDAAAPNAPPQQPKLTQSLPSEASTCQETPPSSLTSWSRDSSLPSQDASALSGDSTLSPDASTFSQDSSLSRTVPWLSCNTSRNASEAVSDTSPSRYYTSPASRTISPSRETSTPSRETSPSYPASVASHNTWLSQDALATSQGGSSPSRNASAMSRDTSPSRDASAESNNTSPFRDASAMSHDTLPYSCDASAMSHNTSPLRDASAMSHNTSQLRDASAMSHNTSPSRDASAMSQDTLLTHPTSGTSRNTSPSLAASAMSRDSSPSHNVSPMTRDTSSTYDVSAISGDTSPTHDAPAIPRDPLPSYAAVTMLGDILPAYYPSSWTSDLSPSPCVSVSPDRKSTQSTLSFDTTSRDSSSMSQDTSLCNTLSPQPPRDITEHMGFDSLVGKELPLGSELVVLTIPMIESQSSSSGISTLSSSNEDDMSTSATSDSPASSRCRSYDSSTNSSPSRATRFFSSEAGSATEASSTDACTDVTSNNFYNPAPSSTNPTDSDSESTTSGTPSARESTSFSTTSEEESSDYEQYRCLTNRNINAKKQKKKGKSSEKEPLVDKKEKDSGDKSEDSKKGDSKEGKESKAEKGESGGKGKSSTKKSSKRKGDREKKSDRDKKGGKRKRRKKKHTKADETGYGMFIDTITGASPYPGSVFYILAGEFCERFAYHGIRSVLMMYLVGWLQLGANEATAVFHCFSCISHISPLLGTALSDGALGRYRAIIYLSIIYAVGGMILSATAFPPREMGGPMIGLFLVSFATGGMKPCVVTFGGEQLPKKEARRRATFFSTFYFVINVTSVISILVSPILRTDVNCVGDTCYPLSFGVPACLMLIATCIFLGANKSFRFTDDSKSNFGQAIKVMCGGKIQEEDNDEEHGKHKKGKKGSKKKRSDTKGGGGGKDKSKKKHKGGDKDKDKKKDKKKSKKDKDGGDKSKNANDSHSQEEEIAETTDMNENKKKDKDDKKGKDKDKKDGDGKKDDKKKDKDQKDDGKKKDDKKEGKKKKDGGKDHKKKDSKKDKKKKDGKGKKGKGKKKSDDKRDKKSINPKKFTKDVKMVKRVLWLFIPFPVFWALFNQQGSRWTLQAAQMDGTFAALGHIKPDQVQALNPFFIILCIPIFERVVYPIINHCGICSQTLQRIIAGMFFCALAFVVAAQIQTMIDEDVEKPAGKKESGYIILNTADCRINVRGNPPPFFEGEILPLSQSKFFAVPPGHKDVSVTCPATGQQASLPAELTEGKVFRFIVMALPGQISLIMLEAKRAKALNGTAFVSFVHLVAWLGPAKIRVSAADEEEPLPFFWTMESRNASQYFNFQPGSYDLGFPTSAKPSGAKLIAPGWDKVDKGFEVQAGGVYTIAVIDLTNLMDLKNVRVEKLVEVKASTVPVFFIIPQYLLITIAEVLFSISGLAFAYSQAPETMKSVIQTFWLLTSAFGDLIVIIVASTHVAPTQAKEYYVYAGVMAVDTVIFIIMSSNYSYADPANVHKKKKDKKKHRSKSRKGKKK